MRQVKYPVLAANVNLQNEPYLHADLFQPSITVDVDGRKIGIIGYLSRDVKSLVGHSVKMDGVEITDEVFAIK